MAAAHEHEHLGRVPFWIHQLVELLLGILLLVQGARSGEHTVVLVTLGCVLLLLALCSDGALGAWPWIGRRLHRVLDVIAAVVLAVSPLVLSLDHAFAIVVLEAAALAMAWLAFRTDWRPRTKTRTKTRAKTRTRSDSPAAPDAPAPDAPAPVAPAATPADPAPPASVAPAPAGDPLARKLGTTVGRARDDGPRQLGRLVGRARNAARAAMATPDEPSTSPPAPERPEAPSGAPEAPSGPPSDS